MEETHAEDRRRGSGSGHDSPARVGHGTDAEELPGGEAEPVATNDTESDCQRNRRVEVVAIPGS